MIRLSPESRRSLQDLPHKIEDLVGAIAASIHAQQAQQLAEAGDAAGLANLSTTSQGETILSTTSPNQVVMTPGRVPLAVQLAQQIARETGRAPIIRFGGDALSRLEFP